MDISATSWSPVSSFEAPSECLVDGEGYRSPHLADLMDSPQPLVSFRLPCRIFSLCCTSPPLTPPLHTDAANSEEQTSPKRCFDLLLLLLDIFEMPRITLELEPLSTEDVDKRRGWVRRVKGLVALLAKVQASAVPFSGSVLEKLGNLKASAEKSSEGAIDPPPGDSLQTCLEELVHHGAAFHHELHLGESSNEIASSLS